MIYQLAIQLRNNNEYVISNQVLKSGTSVGANISEAQYAQSKADFVSKLSISLKEAREAKYWVQFIEQNQILNSFDFDAIKQLNRKIISCLFASIKTTKTNIAREKCINENDNSLI